MRKGFVFVLGVVGLISDLVKIARSNTEYPPAHWDWARHPSAEVR